MIVSNASEQRPEETPFSVERVSVLLRHSSGAVTGKYDAPWVKARQEQVEQDVMKFRKNDPLWLAETKGTRGVRGKKGLANRLM